MNRAEPGNQFTAIATEPAARLTSTTYELAATGFSAGVIGGAGVAPVGGNTNGDDGARMPDGDGSRPVVPVAPDGVMLAVVLPFSAPVGPAGSVRSVVAPAGEMS